MGPVDGVRVGARGKRGLALIGLAALAALLMAFAPAAASAKKVKQGPKRPRLLPAPGQAAERPREADLVPQVEGPGTARRARSINENVLYTSRSPQGERIAVSGSISIPKGKAPKGGWPVITWAHGTTGVADVCAPSRNNNASPAKDYISYINPILSDWLKAGYAVMRTDYEGLGTPGPHPYLIGKSEARSTLDIIRAARQFDPAIGKRYVIAGHSQGGHAALFAAGNASKWTPDLKLRGTMAYAPASHLEAAGSGAAGVDGAELADGAGDRHRLRSRDRQPARPTPTCCSTIPCWPSTPSSSTRAWHSSAPPTSSAASRRPTCSASGAKTGALYKVLANNNPAVVTTAPMLVLQGLADTTVFPQFTNSLVSELEANNDNTDYVTYPGVTHGEIVYAGEDQAMQFLDQQLPAK